MLESLVPWTTTTLFMVATLGVAGKTMFVGRFYRLPTLR